MGLFVIFLVGLPGSGKTTFALKLKEYLKGCTILSKDTYRISQEGFYSFDPSSEEIVKRKFLTDLIMLANSPSTEFLIIDNTNIRASDVLDITATIDNIEKNMIFIVFKKNPDVKFHIVRSVHSNGFDMQKMEMLNKQYDEFVPTIPNYLTMEFDGFSDLNYYEILVEGIANEIKHKKRTMWGFDYVPGNHFRGFPSFLKDEAKKRVYPTCIRDHAVKEPPLFYSIKCIYEENNFNEKWKNQLENGDDEIHPIEIDIKKLLNDSDEENN